MTQGREQIPRAEAFRDLGGAVGAAGIGNDDFVGPQHVGSRSRQNVMLRRSLALEGC